MDYEIPEHVIESSADELDHDDLDNAFTKLLFASIEFKMANLTPVFIYDDDTNELYLTTREKMENKYH